MSQLIIGRDPQKLVDALQPLPWTWAGSRNVLGPCFALAHDGTALHVHVLWREPVDDTRGALGAFTADLWRSDVFELFVGDKEDAETYSEFNFAPSGAWWFSHYTGYRIADPHLVLPLCVATQRKTTRGVECVWKTDIPVTQLRTLNATGFVSTAAAGADRYLTWSPPIGEKPDFHARALRQEITWD